jgi:hypothetical protein
MRVVNAARKDGTLTMKMKPTSPISTVSAKGQERMLTMKHSNARIQLESGKHAGSVSRNGIDAPYIEPIF